MRTLDTKPERAAYVAGVLDALLTLKLDDDAIVKYCLAMGISLDEVKAARDWMDKNQATDPTAVH